MSSTKVHAGADQRYRLNEPAVIADIVDGEAVIMNLERGSYYGLIQIGAEIWKLMLSGYSVDEIAGAVAERYEIDRERVDSDLRTLAAQMIDENLLVAVLGATTPAQTSAAIQFASTAYSPPELRVYSDMKDLLALDPPMPDFKSVPNT